MKRISHSLVVVASSSFVLGSICHSSFAVESPSPSLALNPTPQPAGITADVTGPWMPGSINSGIKTNDAYTDGSFSIVAPVWSSIGSGSTLEGGLIYVEPYISWGEGGEVASSLGMGWRYLFSDQPVAALTDRSHDNRQASFFEEGWAIGASLFLDMLDTQSNRQFWQLGTGVELMSRYVEMRGNYYLPLTGKKESGSFRTRETSTTTQSSTSYATQTTTTDPYATGYTIAQDINQSVIATTQTRTTTTTIERLFRQYEEGLEGWDAELAVLMPWIDRWMDVKLIGGYYHFDNQPFGPQARGTGKVEGWKAGVEIRPVPALALSASWYQDEKLTGSDWIAGFRVELPFETTNIGDGKGGFWGHIKDAFKPRRRHFAERLAEPVHRQNAAVKLGGVTEEKKSAATTTSNLQRITRVVSQTSTRIVLADDVVFVDNSIGAPGNPGTYEAPLDTIQGGENTANGLFGDNGKVFVQGGGADYVENVVVDRSTEFYGSGRGLAGLNGGVFQGRNSSTPRLNGNFAASDIGSLVVSGFDITATVPQKDPFDLGAGVSARNVNSVTIVGNSISFGTAGTGISLQSDFGTMNAVVTDNVISGFNTWSGTVGTGIAMGSPLPSGTIYLGPPKSGTIYATVAGNTLTGNRTGIAVGSSVASSIFATIAGNLIVGSTSTAIALISQGQGSRTVVIMDGNVIRIPQSTTAAITASSDGSGQGNISINGSVSNTIALLDGSTYFLTTVGSLYRIETPLLPTGSFIINDVRVSASTPF